MNESEKNKLFEHLNWLQYLEIIFFNFSSADNGKLQFTDLQIERPTSFSMIVLSDHCRCCALPITGIISSKIVGILVFQIYFRAIFGGNNVTKANTLSVFFILV